MMRCYHTVSLDFDNWEIEGWRNTELSRFPFLRDLKIWCDVGEITLRQWKTENSKFGPWSNAP